ncbi:MAG: hypothetical protein LBT81_01425 [Helicobacteraceae bacterium]|jgi:hypothetical protein|nr:hypothetical protein [Helicobacteraceae bacterium]
MRRVSIVCLLFAVLLPGAEMNLHNASSRMDWERAVEYCRSLDAHVPDLNTMERAFKDRYVSLSGVSPYAMDIYWTTDEFDLEGAYAYDFENGLHIVDFKNTRHRVMCIQPKQQ